MKILKLSEVARNSGRELLRIASTDASVGLLRHTMANIGEGLVMCADNAHEAAPEASEVALREELRRAESERDWLAGLLSGLAGVVIPRNTDETLLAWTDRACHQIGLERGKSSALRAEIDEAREEAELQAQSLKADRMLAQLERDRVSGLLRDLAGAVIPAEDGETLKQWAARATAVALARLHLHRECLAVCAFAATLCTDPDGIPPTRAGIQRSAEVWVEEQDGSFLDFETLYRAALTAIGEPPDSLGALVNAAERRGALPP